MLLIRLTRPRVAVLAGVAAAVVAAGVFVQSQTTASAQEPTSSSSICNKFCDKRDPSKSASDRVPVSTKLFGRTIALHVSDKDTMAWGAITDGNPKDEVWLDRSFNGGSNWSGGSRLGNTAIPTGSKGWRTQMYNVDDWNTRGVGLVRACGKAADRKEVSCTGWARSNWNAWSRSTEAATALMTRYDQKTGLFGGNAWWTSANALTAVIDNLRTSGMPSYKYAIANTYDKQKNAHLGQFRNEFLDDTGWWGLAWVAAYDVTKDKRYLDTARADADFMHQYWDNKCGGGIYWKTDRKSKNAIQNSLYIQLNAELAQRLPGDKTYLGRAQSGWNWFRDAGFINSKNLINDGLNSTTCKNNGSQTWTYNQGVLINALTELNKAGGGSEPLTVAKKVAAAMTSTSGLSPQGVLQEPPNGNNCEGDGGAFKGAAIRGLGALNDATGGTYDAYLKKNADSASSTARNKAGFYGWEWRPIKDGHNSLGVSCQFSAVDLLNAAS